MKPARGLFSISVAAELTGLHPQTLRIYEREGLLDPARSPGGTRRYSTDDLDRLHEITTLMSAGLNLAGVRQVLELQAETRRLQAEIDRLKEAGQEHSQPAQRKTDPRPQVARSNRSRGATPNSQLSPHRPPPAISES